MEDFPVLRLKSYFRSFTSFLVSGVGCQVSGVRNTNSEFGMWNAEKRTTRNPQLVILNADT